MSPPSRSSLRCWSSALPLIGSMRWYRRPLTHIGPSGPVARMEGAAGAVAGPVAKARPVLEPPLELVPMNHRRLRRMAAVVLQGEL